MARHGEADGTRGSEGSRDPVPPRDGGRTRRRGVPAQVRQGMPRGDQHAHQDGPSNTDGASREVAQPLAVPVDPKAVKLFSPETSGDLGIYKRMLMQGAIRPFEMPEGIEKLADDVMRMMHMAQESGRLRDAMKAAEILRMLAADNRTIALEMDKLDRLDAGKPTQIHGQVAPEVQDRIKRIVSVQRARTNTEANDVGHDADRARDPRGAVGGGLGQGALPAHGADPAGRDRKAAEDARAGGTQGEQGADQT